MFLRALRKFIISSENNVLRRDLYFRNGMKNLQHVKYASNVHFSQNVVPDFVATDFTVVEKFWKLNENSEIDNFLFQCFEKEKDCFSYALYLMLQTAHHHHYSRKSLTLAHSIMYAFCQWQESHSVLQPLTTQLQTEALVAALSYKDRLFARLVCSVFRINNQSDFVYDIIENYVAHKKFEEACICILILKMQEKFAVEKVLVPLVFQGNMNLVRIYVSDNRTMQLELVRILDNILQPHSSPQKKSLKMGKEVYNRLNSLLTAYKITPEMCPNLCKIRKKSTVKFLMRKRYLEKSISDACWEEMIMASLHDSPSLQKKLVFQLVDVKDFPTAFKMATKFQIPADEWPSALKHFEKDADMSNFSFNADIAQHVNTTDGSHEVQSGSGIEHLSLHLDTSCLKYVETVEQFEDCLNNISKNYDIIGIDSEWKPTFGTSTKNKLALLQLAVEDHVYLMDVLALNDCLEKSHWDDLMERLFGNPKILKLGCGLMSDVDILIKNHHGTTGIPIKFLRLLDVAVLFQQFQYVCPDILPNNQGNISCNNNLLGLSKICDYVLGSPLKKGEQFSNWEVRPLRDSQLYYAALDAYCLLQIYNKLKEVAEEKDLCFDELLQKSIRLTSEPPRETSEMRRKIKWSKCEEGFQLQPIISIKDFKILVDYRLEDLGRELKFFGADVFFLIDSMNSYEAVEIAKAEDRVILASSLLYEQLRGLISERMCYNISEDCIDDQSIVPSIFQKFNVRVEAQAISCPDPNST